MAWTTRFTDRAKKELAKLDKPIAKRIIAEIRDHQVRVLVIRVGHHSKVYRP